MSEQATDAEEEQPAEEVDGESEEQPDIDPEEMASGASTGATPTAAPSSSKQLANLLKQVRDEIRSLKSALSGERELSGKVEFDPSSGLIRFVDSRVELAETQNFEDFSS